MADVLQMCPSCAGQLSAAGDSCPWCGIALGPDAEMTHVAPGGAKPTVTRPDVGFGAGSSRPLPPMPPPPRALPITTLSPGQIMLRAIVVVILTGVIVMLASRLLQGAACSMPTAAFCPGAHVAGDDAGAP